MDTTLNSNLILLIQLTPCELFLFLKYFKFQSDSINTVLFDLSMLYVISFKFQSDSINTSSIC